MKTRSILCTVLAISAFVSCTPEHVASELRASAYPLVTVDPFLSAWSGADNLYDTQVAHWTGHEFPFVGTLTVDGTSYRFMGTPITTFDLVSGDAYAWNAKYTTSEPKGDWMAPDYSDKSWKSGAGPFGCLQPDVPFATEWSTPYIWVRREFDLDESLQGQPVYLEYSHDDDAVIYVNGIEVANWVDSWECGGRVAIPDEAIATLKPGRNVIAARCFNRSGDAVIDFQLSKAVNPGSNVAQTALQKSVDFQPTQTRYTFTCGPVDLNVTFVAPLLMDDLDLLSRPVNYVSYELASSDGAAHDVNITFEATGGWARHSNTQKVDLSTEEDSGFYYVKAGTKDQNILGRKGDHVCIDWGYFYLATEKDGASVSVNESVMTVRKQLGMVKGKTSGKIMVGYDDIYSIQYFGENLRPYWNRDGQHTIQEQFSLAAAQYDELMAKCNAFDAKMMADAEAAGGRKYAELCAAAYRQCIAAHKLVEAPDGDLLWFSKENDSNGSIGTVDVTYPSAPLFLLYNTELAKGLLNHNFHYSESGRWTKPFPAHDVGTYPIANGQTYGGDMPVEEAGNMLILTAAICKYDKDYSYASKHWDVLKLWADYLLQFGLDPENQLCTDDFAGHSAHNTNLSIKAIVALAGFGQMAEGVGDAELAAKYTGAAKEMAEEWMKMADAGDHYSRTFDNPESWSQKYNLVWDKLLGLGVFPAELARKEIAFYPSVELEYGLPLDERATYTKTDWIVWTATLAEDKADFEHFIDYIYKFECETTDRVAMSDWVWTDKPERRGFIGRSVVGGYFIKMLPVDE